MIATTLPGGKSAPGHLATRVTPQPTPHELARATTGLAGDRRVNHLGGSAVLPGLTRDPRQMDAPLAEQPLVLLVAERVPREERDTLCIAALVNRLRRRCAQLGVDPMDDVRELLAMAREFPQFAAAYRLAAEELGSWITGRPVSSWIDEVADA